ncbi:terminase large subunit [Sphingobium sp. TB-6]|uniref:terminase large subunit n=1 Tax=Sphingobium sp. TB-6 TaxID=2728850 RepID=UPI001469E43F|nr:terminase large subunit [Sphingobium sp. TB-6]NML88748.1 terminase large subunit [Sphingobium sp. TB-6]
MARSRQTALPATAIETGRDYAAVALAYAKKAAADKQQVHHCKWVRLAAQRHLDDLARSKSKDWPYKFDPWHANDVCDFIEGLPHVEGRWETPTLRLEPPQIFILAMVFGWRDKVTGLRRFTDTYIEMARKGAKSTLTAGVVLYCTCCEDEPGPLTLIGATTGAQAQKVFNPAKLMVQKTPDLQDAFGLKAWARAITCGDNGGTIQTINSKSATQDGHNPHLAVLDELHAHKDRGLYDVVHSADGARRNPLYWKITTAGYILDGVCFEQRTFTTKMLDGAIVADHVFGIIFTLDGPKDFTPERKVGDDPYDERNWPKANPLMPITPSLASMRRLAIKAKGAPGEEGEFFTKRLNRWMSAATAWLSVPKWNACGDNSLRLRDFAGLDCDIGADLAHKSDLTALALSAITPDDQLLLKTWFFLPAAVLQRDGQTDRNNVELYRQWHKQGKLILTPGDWVDQMRVERLIRRLKSVLRVNNTVFDHFSAAEEMAVRLNADLDDGTGFASILPKNAKNVTNPARNLEARVNGGPHLLRHDNNPVMTWCVGNAVVDRRIDGSILPKKETPMSMNKIDGIDATVHSLAPKMLPTEDVSIDDWLAGLAA